MPSLPPWSPAADTFPHPPPPSPCWPIEHLFLPSPLPSPIATRNQAQHPAAVPSLSCQLTHPPAPQPNPIPSPFYIANLGTAAYTFPCRLEKDQRIIHTLSPRRICFRWGLVADQHINCRQLIFLPAIAPPAVRVASVRCDPRRGTRAFT